MSNRTNNVRLKSDDPLNNSELLLQDSLISHSKVSLEQVIEIDNK